MFRRILPIALGTVLALASVGTAQAGDVDWVGKPYLTCATGSITSTQVTPTGVGPSLTLNGWIQSCYPLTTAGPYFGFVLYNTQEGYGRVTQQYLTGAASTPFSWTLSMAGSNRAVCLANSRYADGSRSCVSIDVNGTTLTVTPIPTDDPRVTLPYASGSFDGTPECMTCV